MHSRRTSVERLQTRLGNGWLGTISAEGVYRGAVAGLNKVADRTTGFVQHGSLPLYLAVILLTTLGVPAAAFVISGGTATPNFAGFAPAEVVLGAAIIVPAATVLWARRRMAAVLLLGAVGYAMAGLFVFYGAPDLALTLLLVETLAVAIFAFVLVRLPRQFEQPTFRLQRVVRAGVALAVGGFITMAALLAGGSRPSGEVPSAAYLDLAPEAGGTNVVNTILTDFRALDTLGEITVVATAAIGVAALVTGLRVKGTT
jgi:multicomponent Na+:H+ antiporter subunit A